LDLVNSRNNKSYEYNFFLCVLCGSKNSPPSALPDSLKILITAGPTHEAIDPVRYISNRSSGKMGYAITEAALVRGHEVILISGPVTLDAPDGAQMVNVTSADEMYAAVNELLSANIDAAIFCAAVADYRPVNPADQKIKKNEADQLTLVLEKTKDILGNARGEMGYEGLLVGFAAETHDLEKHALSKLASKKCDLVAANDVSNPETGFDSPDNELQLFFSDGHKEILERQPKSVLGEKLIEIIEKLNEARA